MRRTLLLSRVFPPAVGGSGHWMWDLYSRMPEGQVVVAADKSAGCEQFDQSHSLPIFRLPLELESWGAFGWHRGAAYYRLYAQLRRIVHEHGCRAVHASSCLPEGFLAWMLHRRFGLPYAVYVHGEELNVATKSRELAWMMRRVFRSAELIIANSRNTMALLNNHWPVSAQRVKLMHPGVDTNKFRPVARDPRVRELLGWGNRPVVLAVGRLQKRKGQEQLLRAIAKIRHDIPDVLCAIVGDGEEGEKLEQLAGELSLQTHVRFHGKLSQDELVTAFQQCDVFAMPNLEVDGDFEGFGIVFIEAQACGKPVIAGDSGGVRDAVRVPETACVVKQQHPDELPSVLIDLLGDEAKRVRMGNAGRQWVVSNFDWSLLATQAERLFSSLTAQNRNCRSGHEVAAVPALSSRDG